MIHELDDVKSKGLKGLHNIIISKYIYNYALAEEIIVLDICVLDLHKYYTFNE